METTFNQEILLVVCVLCHPETGPGIPCPM